MSAVGLMPATEMTPTDIKAMVDIVTKAYQTIEKADWNGKRYSKSPTQQWIEASQVLPKEWREIIRVLAQGGEYYSIEW